MIKNPSHPKKSVRKVKQCKFTEAGLEYIDYKEVERKRESSGPDRHLVTKMTKREGVDDVLARALPSTVSKSHGDSSSSPSALKSKSKK